MRARILSLIDPFVERPLMTAALLYGAGIWLGGRVAPSACLYIGLGGAALFTLALKLLGRRVLAGALLCMLCLGVLMGSVNLHPQRPPEGEYTVTGVVRDDPVHEDDGRFRMYLQDVSLTDADGRVWRVDGAYLTRYAKWGETLPCDGLRVQCAGDMYHPSGQVNPYGFDFNRYLLLRGVSVGVYAREPVVAAGGIRADFSYTMRRLRDTMARALDRAMGDTSMLARAMLLGDREDMPDEMRDSFSRLGIAHILAVSGLHVSFIILPLGWALRKLRLNRWLVFALCELTLAFYCALVGFTASVLRAALLWTLISLGRNLWRPYDRATALSLAFLIILLIRPLDLYSASFQLTFCAMGGILLIYSPLKAQVKKLPKPKGKIALAVFDALANGICLSLAATAGVCLPLVTLYHKLSLIGVLISPFACFAAFVLILLYLITLIAALILPGVGGVIGAAAGFCSRLFLDSVAWLDGLNFGSVNVATPNLYITAAVVLCLILVSRYVLLTPRKRALLALSSLALAVAVTMLTTPGEVRYVQLSVGQADSAVIEDGGFTYVIDTGDDGYDLAEYLLATGRGADYLIITHLHSDHAGGVEHLLDSGVRVGVVFLPDAPVEADNPYLLLLKASGVPISYISSGDTLKSDRVTLTALWPVEGTARPTDDLNLYSLTFLADVEGASLLLTGDLKQSYEMYAAVPADVLKVAHHGSASSSTDAFLDAVAPKVALISCSDTRYLPSPATLARLAARPSIDVYRTNEQGAITLTFHHDDIVVTSYLPAGEP